MGIYSNHVNTWRDATEQMTVVAMTQRLNKTKYITTIYYKPINGEELDEVNAF